MGKEVFDREQRTCQIVIKRLGTIGLNYDLVYISLHCGQGQLMPDREDSNLRTGLFAELLLIPQDKAASLDRSAQANAI